MFSRTKRMIAVAVVAAAALVAQQQTKLRDLKPGFNLFSKEQDVQMGREYAQQIEQQFTVVNDGTINNFIQGIGRRLASTREAQGFQYTFKVVNEKSINAFALPGGPTFTHTGLITAADNEAQIAGVLAHEISHVILRHSTNQASKAQLLALPAALAGGMLGQKGGITGTLAQLGIGLGANSVLMKFSRGAERDADLMGARIMNEAGYNPIEMARFFEKLEAETGRQGKLSEFLSDHPNPGNRVKAVQDEIRLLPQRSYTADAGDLSAVKAAVQRLPAAPKKTPQQQMQQGRGGGSSMPQGSGNPSDYTAARPSSRLRDFQGGEVTFSYPDNWEVFPNEQTREITIASKAGMVGGGIGYGMIANMVQTNGGNLDRGTQDLVNSFRQRDPNLQVASQGQRFSVNGYNAIATRMQGQSPFQGTNEALVLVTVERPQGLFFILFIAPERDMNTAQPVYDQIIRSIRFSR
ncbi:MAG: M48 family metalloprotease [Bryobacterales bacterium]|nr:M48 family metalloprotease [Bryobacterales bacterium]